MQRISQRIVGLGCTTLVVLVTPVRPTLQERGGAPEPLTLTATERSQLRESDQLVDRMLRGDDLQVTQVVADTMVPGRSHERLAQYHQGVRVFGADVARQTARGLTTSVFGRLHTDIQLDTTPALSADTARVVVEDHLGVSLSPRAQPELLILRDETNTYRLVHRVRALSPDGLMVCFVDAHSGAIVWEYNDLQTQDATLPCTDCAVGQGRGVKGDRKKISVRTMGGAFWAVDRLRPPSIRTYDMRGDWERTWDILDGFTPLVDADLASDVDNNWRDGATVDAHTGAGWTYDYLFDRFGRRGLDGNDSPMVALVHPVRRRDVFIVPDEIESLFLLNAFYCSECGANGLMVYGEGLPPGVRLTNGQTVDFFSAALDIVAHEFTHALTEATSDLIYQGESGALNEAFSDIIGTGVEFFMAETGRHPPERADYLLGEDVFKPDGIRSLADLLSFGDPDHYSIRFPTSASFDNGYVHFNSSIANHAFYLAIEGGTNRTSGLTVTGVGAANRAQIEQVFFRAFTMMLPADATFSVARAATIQSARDLFGVGSAVEQAVTAAWTAVGVQ